MARIREKTLKFPGLDNVYTFADEADLFDANVPCNAGEYRMYGGDLYRCDTDHTGAWNAAHFTPVKLGNEVSTALASAVGQFAQKTIENVAIATFNDGAENVPVKSLVIDIAPVQSGSGDPAPDNVRPITGWTGANVFRTGKNMLSYTPTRLTNAQAVQFDITRATLLKANEAYKLSFNFENATTWRIGAVIFDLSGNRYYNPDVNIIGAEYGRNDSGQYYVWNGNYSLTESNILPVIDCYVMLFFLLGDTSESTVMKTVQLELGTATAYEPYTGTTFPITFPAAAGTVYGATLENHGTDAWKLRVDRAKRHFSGNDTWTIVSGTETANRAILMLDGAKTGSYIGILSDVFAPSAFSAPPVYAGCQSPNTSMILGVPLTITSRDEMNAWVTNNPFDVVYYLETPVEYTITAEAAKTLLGLNNIWADTGDIDELIYRTMNNTDAKIQLTKALIAPVLDEMVAEEALSVNDFVIVGDTLYIITADVAADGALTPGTNCAATTIGEQITALLNA